jgi:hypothetical protein
MDMLRTRGTVLVRKGFEVNDLLSRNQGSGTSLLDLFPSTLHRFLAEIRCCDQDHRAQDV